MKTPSALAACLALALLSSDNSSHTVSGSFLPGRHQVSWATYERAFPGVFSYVGPHRKIVALTFDDGPDDVYTPQILQVLRKLHVRATFFVIGEHVRAYPRIAQEIVREGHAIGNHTWDHPDLRTVSKERLEWEVTSGDRELVRATGLHTNLFRAPYGAVDERLLQTLRRLHYHAFNWSVDTNDWRSLPANRIRTTILHEVGPGAIILQHSAGGHNERLGGTVQALPDVIRELRKRGYTFVTIPELLGDANASSRVLRPAKQHGGEKRAHRTKPD
ncbi:MAG: polysaccharide deacetylase family protein [Firmicutes bacterium]|nr:polysaccharide deacetylase family protein [Bacillota bacterium]